MREVYAGVWQPFYGGGSLQNVVLSTMVSRVASQKRKKEKYTW